jgi:phage-related baseplate assembly protein
MPTATDPATSLLEAARSYEIQRFTAETNRDAAIRCAYDEGATLDDIARATALDLPTIRKITQEDF